MGDRHQLASALSTTPQKRFQRNQKVPFENVWIREQVGRDGGEVAKGSSGLDLEAEDCGARPGSVGQDAPQGGAGQEHPFRSENLERRGERKGKCFCLPSLRFDIASKDLAQDEVGLSRSVLQRAWRKDGK